MAAPSIPNSTAFRGDCVAHQPFDLPFVVALARAPELVGEQIMTLQLRECLRLAPRPVSHLCS